MLKELGKFGVLPVVAVDSVDDGLRLCEALLAGGLAAAEITFRTAAAEGAIRAAVQRFPEMTIGAGTILTVADLGRAIEAGAVFAVAPGCNPTVVAAAVAAGFAFAPGVCTPSDIERAVELGVRELKFFPAEAAGGVPMLKALIAPYAHLGLVYCPTGGVNPGNLGDYLKLPQVPVVGGTWLAPREAMQAGQWQRITELACQAVAISQAK